jgi:predicted Zn-dependent protease
LPLPLGQGFLPPFEQQQHRLVSFSHAGVVAAEEGDYAEAVRLFTAATTADPDCAALHEMLAQCALQHGHDAVALTAAQRAVDLEPERSACKTPALAPLVREHVFRRVEHCTCGDPWSA